jgi:hypothetical protein
MKEIIKYDFRKKVNKGLLRAWDTLLQDFASVQHPIFGGERINIPDEYEQLFNPRHIYMVFVTILDYFHENIPVEKVEWFIPLKYKGITFQMGNLKYGFRIYVFDIDKEDPIINEFIKRLHSLIKLSDGLISPYLDELMQSGEFTLKNDYYFLFEMYFFYKDKLIENEKEILKLSEAMKVHDIPRKELIDKGKEKLGRKAESFYYFYAMMDSFFSLLEHLCVLLLAMDKDYNSGIENVQDFIFNTNWTEKYNRIFKDYLIFKKRYNKLHIVKEKYRNTFSHGGFEKNGNPVFVHVPGVGALPIALSKFKDTVRSTYLPKRNETYEELIKVFDDFFVEMESDKTFSRKLKIIKSMRDIIYNYDYHQKYTEAVKSNKKLNDFFKIEDLLLSRYIDMDW